MASSGAESGPMVIRQGVRVGLLCFACFSPAPLQAQTCDQEACISLFESAGNVMAEVASADQTKHYGFSAVDIDIPFEDRPILISEFNAAGFSCNGGLGVPQGTAGAGGQTYSTSMTCSFQNSNGQTWRVTVTISWMYNAALGKWEIADIVTSAKLIKGGNQVQ